MNQMKSKRNALEDSRKCCVEREKDIPSSLDGLGSITEMLEKRMADLVGRLEPVMIQVPTAAGPKDCPPYGGECQVSQAVRSANVRIERCVDIVVSLLDRLEV